jgi:hypothetical protein
MAWTFLEIVAATSLIFAAISATNALVSILEKIYSHSKFVYTLYKKNLKNCKTLIDLRLI